MLANGGLKGGKLVACSPMAFYWLLQLLAFSLAWHHASTQQCLTEERTGAQTFTSCSEDDGGLFCNWQQEILRQSKPKDYSKCTFVVRDPTFLDLFTVTSKLEMVTEADAHEGGVYNPDDDCFYFASTKQKKPKPNTKIMKMHLQSSKVEVVREETEVANGMTIGKDGQLLVCHQGLSPNGGFIESLHPNTLESSIVADNWQGHSFNSPNDVVVKSDGSIWFTDPDYGWLQGFGKEPGLRNQVYRVSPTGVVDVVADGLVRPNGLAFSPDERVLYVTDTGSTFADDDGTVDKLSPHSIYAFDLREDGEKLHNKRLFASISMLVGKYEGIGCPDGIKVDTMGRVYVGNVDGIQVLDSKGKLLGLIKVPSSVNMGFAGVDSNILVILNDTAIHKVTLSARGAGLHHPSFKLRESN